MEIRTEFFFQYKPVNSTNWHTFPFKETHDIIPASEVYHIAREMLPQCKWRVIKATERTVFETEDVTERLEALYD